MHANIFHSFYNEFLCVFLKYSFSFLFLQEGISQQNLTRVRRFQRELEAAEDRAEAAEGNLSMIRAKHRSWVTTNQIPGGGVRQVFITEETSSSNY